MSKLEKEYIERLITTEDRSKSNTKRLDEVEQEVKENRELTVAVKEIATEIKHLREEQSSMNERLKIIEEKPFKEYESTKHDVKKQIVTFILGIILCFIAMKLGLGNFI